MSLIRFLQAREASVAPMLALLALPLFASGGASIDFGRAASARAEMQAALDASVLMMAKDAKVADGTQLNANARDYFNSNFQNTEVGNIATVVTTSSTSSGYTVSMSAGRGGDKVHGGDGLFEPQSGGAIQRSIQYRRPRMRSVARSAHGGATTGQGSTSVVLNGCSLYDNPTARRRSRLGDRPRLRRYRSGSSAI